MSQHLFQTDLNGRPVTVTIGYDRPLDYVFCTVIPDAKDDSPVYSNLDDDLAGTRLQDVDYFRGLLDALDIVVPDEMFLGVKADQRNRAGNRLEVYKVTDCTRLPDLGRAPRLRSVSIRKPVRA